VNSVVLKEPAVFTLFVFCPEDGGWNFVRNVGYRLWDYTLSCLGRQQCAYVLDTLVLSSIFTIFNVANLCILQIVDTYACFVRDYVRYNFVDCLLPFGIDAMFRAVSRQQNITFFSLWSSYPSIQNNFFHPSFFKHFSPQEIKVSPPPTPYTGKPWREPAVVLCWHLGRDKFFDEWFCQQTYNVC